jgi:hypothetical protein
MWPMGFLFMIVNFVTKQDLGILYDAAFLMILKTLKDEK